MRSLQLPGSALRRDLDLNRARDPRHLPQLALRHAAHQDLVLSLAWDVASRQLRELCLHALSGPLRHPLADEGLKAGLEELGHCYLMITSH